MFKTILNGLLAFGLLSLSSFAFAGDCADKQTTAESTVDESAIESQAEMTEARSDEATMRAEEEEQG